MTRPAQLPLPFPRRDCYPAEEFIADASNEAALRWLENPRGWPGLRLAVHGEAGCGKTHLLHVFAARHGAALLHGAAIATPADFPETGPIAVDDADRVADEAALLHGLNAAAERGSPVLLAARTPPSRWARHLADLESRLRAITSVNLGRPSDELLRLLLARLLADAQLAVPDPVQAYLLARLPRSAASVREAAWRLDQASLVARSRITRPIAAEIVALMGHGEDEGFASDPGAPSPEQAEMV